MAEPAVAEKEAPLSELMLAMDVVDTLRHGETLVERELSDEARRARMIDRLREIYRGQGIAVPDRILSEGVDALEQERFAYKPKSGGLAFTLARLYVRRDLIGRRVGIGVLILLVLVGGWFFLIEQPRQRAAERLEVELTETIPADLASLSEAIAEEALDPAVAAAAATTADDGAAAAAAGNAEAARAAVSQLEATLAELRLTFEVRVVSRQGIQSGVFRIPDDNADARNYYLIVEAIGPDGNAIPRAITSEEDGSVRTVTMWGVRVSQEVYDAIASDKGDDGIVGNDVLGRKARGELEIEWLRPVEGGAITSW